MIHIYSRGTPASRKAKAWLDERAIPYTESLLSKGISRAHLIKILSLTENGVEEILSERTKAFKDLNIDLETLSLTKLLDLVESHPILLKNPIIFNDHLLQVGFNEEELRTFLPPGFRRRKSV